MTGLGLAVAVRVSVAGLDGSRSVPAGLVFAAALGCVALACGMQRPSLGWRHWAWGTAAAALLCAPAALHRLTQRGLAVPDGFVVFACVVTLVAVGEEALLRGAMYEAIRDCWGIDAAIGVTTAAFALLHVPVYGWHVVPLDLAAGLVLGTLRQQTGSVTAPATAHVAADLAGWWLR
jgi:membrane protease YdiL (CAAX protease family)